MTEQRTPSLRAWLVRQPQPAAVLCTAADGSERRVRIGVTRSKWRDAEEACAGSVRLEALTEEGDTIRVCDLEGSPGSRTAPPPLDAKADERVMLREIAALLATTADQAAARHEGAYKLAFEHQTLMLRAVLERLLGLEKAWQRALMQAPADDTPTDTNGPLVAQVLSLLAGGALGGAPSNGAAEKKDG